MSLEQEINSMVDRLVPNEPTTRKRKIELYSHGVIAKYKNADYALSKLNELNKHRDDKTIADENDLLVRERIHFYLDSFFAFVYSTFDVTSQVINQKWRIDMDEKRVSIKGIKNHLNNHNNGTDLQTLIDSLCRANYFKNLDKYRNCSTHRRQIYIKCEATLISETPGYSSTADLETVQRYICDDPYALTPNTNQNREIIDYCRKMIDWTESKLIEISKNI
jgi:hypothetical protein